MLAEEQYTNVLKKLEDGLLYHEEFKFIGNLSDDE